jgi:hypothetical protein
VSRTMEPNPTDVTEMGALADDPVIDCQHGCIPPDDTPCSAVKGQRSGAYSNLGAVDDCDSRLEAGELVKAECTNQDGSIAAGGTPIVAVKRQQSGPYRNLNAHDDGESRLTRNFGVIMFLIFDLILIFVTVHVLVIPSEPVPPRSLARRSVVPSPLLPILLPPPSPSLLPSQTIVCSHIANMTNLRQLSPPEWCNEGDRPADQALCESFYVGHTGENVVHRCLHEASSGSCLLSSEAIECARGAPSSPLPHNSLP